MDTTGIETVRRDNCLLVKNLVNECLHKLLIDRDIPGAVQFVENTIYDLLMNHMDLSLLVITKRDTATAPNVIVKAAKPLPRIFDPIWKNASRELLHGSHTRSISISAPSNSGIMKFA